jgi:hypothetical protein
MHAFFHTKAAQRRSVWAADARAKQARPCLMQLTVATDALSTLRALVAGTCGDALEFMRVEACDHGERVKVWLCLSSALTSEVMAAVMRALPGAEFGRLTPLAQRLS